jgi:hypothetical protein
MKYHPNEDRTIHCTEYYRHCPIARSNNAAQDGGVNSNSGSRRTHHVNGAVCPHAPWPRERIKEANTYSEEDRYDDDAEGYDGDHN